MKDDKKIRVVVIGGGAVAQARHLPEYATNPRAEVAGVLDFNRERAKELCERFGGIPYTSLEGVLADSDVDAVRMSMLSASVLLMRPMQSIRSAHSKPANMYWSKNRWHRILPKAGR